MRTAALATFLVIILTAASETPAGAVTLGDTCSNTGQIRTSDNSAEGLILCRQGLWIVPQKSGYGLARLPEVATVTCAGDTIGRTAMDRTAGTKVVCTAGGWVTFTR